MLNQSEIDALLSGAIEIEQEGEENINLASILSLEGEEAGIQVPVKEKKVRPYNFWSPNRFSKEQIRAIELIHEDIAERLTSSQPPFLRTEFRPRVVHIEQGRFDQFMRDLPEHSLFHIVNYTTLPGKMIMTISPEVSYILLEYQLGGGDDRIQADHVMTDIDHSIMRGIVSNMFNDIKAAWSRVAIIEPSLEDSTDNQRWIQMLVGSERVLSITFEISVQEVTGAMQIFMPYSMIKQVSSYLNPHILISGKTTEEKDMESHNMLMANVLQVEIPLRVILGKTELSIEEILSLDVGDVIRLDASVHKDVMVYVDEQPKFTAQLGKLGKRLAAMVTSVIKLH